jgi:hypothetical protein
MTISVGTIDNTLLRVAKVQTFSRGKPTTNAKGFFYLPDEWYASLIPAMLPRHAAAGSSAQKISVLNE